MPREPHYQVGDVLWWHGYFPYLVLKVVGEHRYDLAMLYACGRFTAGHMFRRHYVPQHPERFRHSRELIEEEIILYTKLMLGIEHEPTP